MPPVSVREDGAFRERTDVQRARSRTDRGTYTALARSTRADDGIAYGARARG